MFIAACSAVGSVRTMYRNRTWRPGDGNFLSCHRSEAQRFNARWSYKSASNHQDRVLIAPPCDRTRSRSPVPNTPGRVLVVQERYLQITRRVNDDKRTQHNPASTTGIRIREAIDQVPEQSSALVTTRTRTDEQLPIAERRHRWLPRAERAKCA